MSTLGVKEKIESTGLQKRDLLLLGYHLFSAIILTILYLKDEFVGGPCNLGFGLLIFLLAGLILIILLLISVFLIVKNKSNKIFLIINLAALAIWITSLFLI
jgi:uncharacterized membrane protein